MSVPDLHRLDVHDRRHDALDRRLLVGVAESLLDAGVDEEQTLGRMVKGVEVDRDRLRGVLEAGGARALVIEVEQSAERHLPVGAGDRLDHHGSGLCHQCFELGGGSRGAEARLLDRVLGELTGSAGEGGDHRGKDREGTGRAGHRWLSSVVGAGFGREATSFEYR